MAEVPTWITYVAAAASFVVVLGFLWKIISGITEFDKRNEMAHERMEAAQELGTTKVMAEIAGSSMLMAELQRRIGKLEGQLEALMSGQSKTITVNTGSPSQVVESEHNKT
jgi:hypothetical protein